MNADPVAIIPARAGSKRIPGKNIREFNGLPMIAHSIKVALSANLFSRILVSTDSDEIAALAEQFGAECAFRRPKHLADDHSTTAAVVHHALEWLGEHGIAPRFACTIYATAPFIQSADLRDGLDIITRHDSGSVFPVTSYGFPIFRSLKVTAEGDLAMFWPEHELTRSQDLPEAYHDAGQFYWLQVERFMRDRRLYCPDSRPVILPRWRVQDIDTPEDWRRAELMHTMLRELGALA